MKLTDIKKYVNGSRVRTLKVRAIGHAIKLEDIRRLLATGCLAPKGGVK
jgi:hypothetical protein